MAECFGRDLGLFMRSLVTGPHPFLCVALCLVLLHVLLATTLRCMSRPNTTKGQGGSFPSPFRTSLAYYPKVRFESSLSKHWIPGL